MKRKVKLGAAVGAALLALAAALPASHEVGPLGSSERAAAQVSKSRGEGSGGGGDAARVGDRAAKLGSGWAIPLTIFVAGALLAVALVSRNVGAAVGVVVVAVVALIFFASPESISGFAEDVARAIF